MKRILLTIGHHRDLRQDQRTLAISRGAKFARRRTVNFPILKKTGAKMNLSSVVYNGAIYVTDESCL
jgi:hypothetical protein